MNQLLQHSAPIVFQMVLMGLVFFHIPADAADVLRVCPENPRYFYDDSGKAIYLTGSHYWSNFKDMGPADPPAKFDYVAYLDFLTLHGHNFIRLWTWDLVQQPDGLGGISYNTPFPWPRTGPGEALDGKPKFDLSKFDQAYFDRLRDRVKQAQKHNIYVSIMLFEGNMPPYTSSHWNGHPFHPANNINKINGELDIVYTLKLPVVIKLQKAYVCKVIDTVNDLDNVLYEICNEAPQYSTEWQYHMIRYIKNYEATKSYQHPVGMTCLIGSNNNKALFESPADWVSPGNEKGGDDYQENPPPSDGRKVVLPDTDHLWGIGGTQAWVWKSFCRGLNPIFMDPYLHNDTVTIELKQPDAKWDTFRDNLGHTRRFAERMNLLKMKPAGELTSSGYCLAYPGHEYLVYLPAGGEVTVDLSAAPGQFAVEWFNPTTGKTSLDKIVEDGEKRVFTAPFNGDAVLYICL